MKIEIHNVGNGMGDLNIYISGNNKPLRNMRRNTIGLYCFDDEDVLNLLGDVKYKRYEVGEYIFNVNKSLLDLVCGNRSACNRVELNMYQD